MPWRDIVCAQTKGVVQVDASLMREHEGDRLYADDEAHIALVLRTLRIDEPRWRRTVDGYTARCAAAAAAAPLDVDRRLQVLGAAYRAATPTGEEDLPQRAPAECPSCGADELVPAYARSRREAPDAAFAYAQCRACGHALLLDARVPTEAYASPAYYQLQTAAGVGYDDYASERAYREAKGRRLFEGVFSVLRTPARSLLEVGSGFGFTRAAAHALGLHSLGVDLNPFAAAAAHTLYGMETIVGTLGDALTAGSVRAGEWDLVLYNFVLEHVADPDAELRHARTALRPGGALVLVVPSMDAREIEVFGGSYRSFRSDHLHMFSRRSLTRYLTRAGFEVDSMQTTCNAHLLRGFLTDAELEALYAQGEGPDLTAVARRR